MRKRSADTRSVAAPERGPLTRFRPHDRRGFTLVEIMLVVALVGVLLAFAVPNYQRAVHEARVTRCIGDIQALEKGILFFEVTKRNLPLALDDLDEGALEDPWEGLYEYANFAALEESGKKGKAGKAKPRKYKGEELNLRFDLYSKGEDGATKTDITAEESLDDIIRAENGSFIGPSYAYPGN